MNQYMIEFSVPQPMTTAFMSRIPAHRARINELMAQGKILSYSLALDRSTVWAVISARTEAEAAELVDSMPLGGMMDRVIHELMFHNALSLSLPAVSMN
ncbi:MAG: muconolactone Delta-isomerase family protein [Bacteroidia bacterium]|nr:muconolactone Delta-isomerase family protein [Bacteroidia bacterium]